MRVSLRLREAREELALSVEELASVVGYSPEDLERWEAGAAMPAAPELVGMGEALSVSIDWLVGRQVRERWSPALHAARLKLRYHLLGREDDPGTPGARVVRVCDLIKQQLPPISTLLFTRWLGLSPSSYRLMANDSLPASTVVIERAALLSGLPERWFRTGRVDDMVHPPLEEYSAALLRLREEGLGPEDVLRVLNVAKAMKRAENGAP